MLEYIWSRAVPVYVDFIRPTIDSKSVEIGVLGSNWVVATTETLEKSAVGMYTSNHV